MTLPVLSLSRTTLDRDAVRRPAPGLVEGLLHEPGTAVLVLHGSRAPVTDTPGGPRLLLLDPAGARALRGSSAGGSSAGGPPLLEVYLGLEGGRACVAVVLPEVGGGLPDGARWAGLREIGATVDDAGAGLFTAAVALANWHAVHPRCPRCGAATDVVPAGGSRRCPEDGSEHYPRTDPAVIMAIVDPADRLLLGRQAAWPPGRYSTLAGFVEPGESLEAAVRREVLEEAGVVVGPVEYRGNQPWPFPASLMLGFRGAATSTAVTVDGDELADARWWTREEFAADLADGSLLLPPTVSIARRLVEDWYGGPVTDAGTPWA